MLTRCITRSNHILHGDQTRQQEKFSQARPRPITGQFFCDTKLLTRDLIAAANLVVIHCATFVKQLKCGHVT